MDLGANYFGVMDYILLGATLLICLLIGLWFGLKGNQTNEELLVGGRNMNIFPVAASVMVSYVSAITIIGLPSEVYARGAQVYMLQIVSAIGIFLSPFVFVPFFYEMKLTSIYEYLEKRFDTIWIRWLASATFILQTVLLNGVVLYAPSIALEAFLGFPMWLSILGVGICATIYTNVGGIKAVVWTDAFQFLMMIGGMLIIVFKGFSAAGGFWASMEISSEKGRMHLFDFTFDPFAQNNFWNIALGLGLHAFMQPGTHQIQVQRYSGMPSRRKAIQAIAASSPLQLLIMSLCLLTGFAIFAFYAHCDPIRTGKVEKVDDILPYFVVHEMQEIPGMIGIFTSCIFSAVLSSLSSCLNSLAAVTWEDFLSRMKFFQKMSPRAQTNVTKITGVVYGIIFIILAFFAQHLGEVFTASYAVVLATAGVLYGIFIMAMFLPFVNGKGATWGGLCGLVTVLTLRMLAFKYEIVKVQYLPTSVDHCPDELIISVGNTTTILPPTNDAIESLGEWPWKIFSLSYLLYPVLGAVITIVVGTSISLFTSRCFTDVDYKKQLPSQKYIHPAARTIFARFISQKEDNKENVNNDWDWETNHNSFNTGRKITQDEYNDIILKFVDTEKKPHSQNICPNISR